MMIYDLKEAVIDCCIIITMPLLVLCLVMHIAFSVISFFKNWGDDDEEEEEVEL